MASRVEEPSTGSQTESKFSTNMPYLKESTQSDNTGTCSSTSPEDSVFTSHSNNLEDTQLGSQITSPTPSIPRRSTRSTRGQPPERYGQVYTSGTIIQMLIDECPKYTQTMYIPCYNC